MVPLNKSLISYVKNSSHLSRAIAVALFWYFLTFPGRAGFDTVLAIKLMREGQTTAWWTAWYFRVLQVLTFNGKAIWLFSLVGILTLTLSFLYFIKSIPVSEKMRSFAFYATVFSPIFGVFGVTVQHDVLQTSGLFMLIALEIRQSRNFEISKRSKISVYTVAFLLMATSHAAVITFTLAMIVLIIRYREVAMVFLLSIGFYLLSIVSAVGIDSSWMKYGKFDSVVLDLKCIAQHPDARISVSQWNFLETMLPLETWKEMVRCDTLAFMPFKKDVNYKNVGINQEFIKTYLSIALQNPSLWAQSHIVRTTIALPPPFFQGPENMVELDYSKPVGEGANWALQIGNPVIHPSIDDPSLKIEIPILHQLDFLLAQSLSFLINQASWFWGWPGLWLWPTMLLLFLVSSLGRHWLMNLISYTYPILSLHLFYVAFGWGPTSRHLQFTIIIGIFATVIFFNLFISFVRKLFIDKQ